MVNKTTLDSFATFTKTSRMIQDEFKQWLTHYKLSPTEFSVLQVLNEKGQQTVQQICNQVLLTSGSMTYVIDRLQDKGLLIRSDCREDRRVVHVKMTSKGLNLMNILLPRHEEYIGNLFQGVSLAQQRELINILKKLGESKISLV